MLGRLVRAYRPPAMDMAIAAGFAVVGQLVTWGRLLEQPWAFAGPRAANAVLNLLLMSALAWRRQAPLAAVCWAVGVYILPHTVVDLDTPFLAGFVPLIVLTASAGYVCSRRRAVVAAVVALVGVVAITLVTPSLRSADGLAYNAAFLLAPWLGARGLREREDRAARLAAELATERAATNAAVQEAATAERARIARELHDIVAHSVSMMVIQAGAARMKLDAGPEDAERPLLDTERIGRQTLDDLRRLLGVLRGDTESERPATDPQPPQPGLGDLEGLIAQTRAAGMRIALKVTGDPVELPPALDLTAYRIVQEALTNTLKHGAATNATVALVYTASALIIDVLDDGRTMPAGDDSGHGLVGIRERAALFGGTAATGPADGGWRVHAELPLPSRSLQDPTRAVLRAS